MNNIQLETATATITLVPRSYRGHLHKKVRVYVSGATPELPVPPYGIEGENEADDAAWRRYNREEVRLQRAAALIALTELVRADSIVIHGSEGKLAFSKYARCSCGCSGGLIMDTSRVLVAGMQLDSIHVTTKASVG